MMLKKNKITREYSLKNLVSVLIPRIDRSGVDFQRLPGMICSISNHNGEIFYKILTVYGILNDTYRVSDFEPFLD